MLTQKGGWGGGLTVVAEGNVGRMYSLTIHICVWGAQTGFSFHLFAIFFPTLILLV